MFKSDELKKHFDTADVIRSTPKVVGEINLNDLERIKDIGNYTNSQTSAASSVYPAPDSMMRATVSYDISTLAPRADADSAAQIEFHNTDDNLARLYPLQDCFGANRPRSGINKAMYFPGRKYDDIPSARRPRYYVSSPKDKFKYWTSFRMEGTVQKGISNSNKTIEDAAPFVAYNATLPANRIVVKMQTHVGDDNRSTNTFTDPFFGATNMRTPKAWSVQVLKGGMWKTAYDFIGNVPVDGYVELGYGIKLPAAYAQDFELMGQVDAVEMLPEASSQDFGDAFLIPSGTTVGSIWVINSAGVWETFTLEYGWSPVNASHLIKTLMDPPSYLEIGNRKYREFDTIDGLRIVVSTMNLKDTPFELIELSPRLTFDLTDRAQSFSITKTMGDLGNSSLPVGSLVAGTGNITLSDNDFALNDNFALNLATGDGSVIAGYVQSETKFSFSETIYNVNGKKYTVPLKVLSSEASPRINNSPDAVSLELRDDFAMFEKFKAPQIMLKDVSLSRIIMVLLDNIGFGNYAFLRSPDATEPVIPYFFVTPDTSVADVLSSLSQATQSAMYFDEFNNFIVSMREYALPDTLSRDTDFMLRGNDSVDGIANIQQISSASKDVFNAGDITFTKRYIQRASRLSQSLYQDSEKTWYYAPIMVWEVAGKENTKGQNGSVAEQSAFALSAFPLSTDLSADLPSVQGGVIFNNTINVGDSINYYSGYNGYLWANGEVIKYDAVQFSITAQNNQGVRSQKLAWIHNADEYQDYFLSLPFNGRIFPTGLIRIYSSPDFISGTNGAQLVPGIIEDNGRGQFNTDVKEHLAGLGSDWNTNRTGMYQNSDYLFTLASTVQYPDSLTTDVAGGLGFGGSATLKTQQGSIITSEINNPLAMVPDTGKIDRMQSSALVFSGTKEGKDHVSYTYRDMSQDNKKYNAFGTRMRVIGEVLSTGDQQPVGAESLARPFTKTPLSDLAISGGGGGIGILVDPSTNHGYFMELQALTTASGDYTLESIPNEADLGKMVGATVVNDTVTLTLANASTVLAVGDSITVSGFPIDNVDINGSFVVTALAGIYVSYELPVVPFIFSTPFDVSQTITKTSGTGSNLTSAQIKSISVDDKGEALVSTTVSAGYSVGTVITLNNFETSSSVPDINGAVTVTWIGNYEFKFNILKRNATFTNELAGAGFSYSGMSYVESEIDTIAVTTEDISFALTPNPATKVMPSLPASLAGTSLQVNRANEYVNPRFNHVDATAILATNLAQSPQTADHSYGILGRWKPSLYSTSKKHAGKLVSKGQVWSTTGGPADSPSNVKLAYSSGSKSWSRRGFLIAGNPDRSGSAPSSGEDFTSALPITGSTRVAVGIWVKSNKKTSVQIYGRASTSWSTERKIGAKTELPANTWVRVFGILDINFVGTIHMSVRFASSKSAISYYGTGLTIQSTAVGAITPSYYFGGNQYYNPMTRVSTVGKIIAQQSSTLATDTDGKSLELWRLGDGDAYGQAYIGNMPAGEYAVSIDISATTEKLIVTRGFEVVSGAQVQPVFAEAPAEGEAVGTRSAGNQWQLVTIAGGETYLRLPVQAAVFSSVFYDNLLFEKVPAGISEYNKGGLTFFTGADDGAKWADETIGGLDNSKSIIEGYDAGIPVNETISGLTSNGTSATFTTSAVSDAAVGNFVIVSGVVNMEGPYQVTAINTGARTVTVATTNVAGSWTAGSAALVAVKQATINLPSKGISGSKFPIVAENQMFTVMNTSVPEYILENPFRGAAIVKTWEETPKLFNAFFYKTVTDDRGATITAVNGTTVTAKGNTLKMHDTVVLSGPGAPTTQFTVMNLMGDDIILNVAPGAMTGKWIGLVVPLVTPFRLWAGLTSVIVDSGQFTGMQRNIAQADNTVYDLCVEYSGSDTTAYTFNLYLNDNLIAVVEDPNPSPESTCTALFVRGGAKIMFEHMYAIGNKAGVQRPAGSLAEITNNSSRFDAVRKSGTPAIMRSSYFNGVGEGSSKYNMFYDEFGTIMREAAFMNVTYDKAYPAMTAQIAPAPAGFRGFEVSGFQSTAYGAEFMVFNCTDNILALSEDTGNYLRILGITFTQDSTKVLSVDDLLGRDSKMATADDLGAVAKELNLYNRIRAHRMKYGEKKFSLQTDYIQSTGAAENLLHWIVEKTSRERKNIGAAIFPIPTLQLGDLVTFDYVRDQHNVISDPTKKYVVYNVTYDKNADGTAMTVYATEV